jgi:hypothetical protein
MSSPTYVITIIDKVDDLLTIDVSACNHPNQTVPQKKFFVWVAVLDAFYQRYKSGVLIDKLNEGKMKWKEGITAHPYALLFQLNVHFLERWLGNVRDVDDLSLFEDYKAEFIAEFQNDPKYTTLCDQLKSYPKISDMIEQINIVKKGTYILDKERNEQLEMKILNIKVSDKELICHCEKGASWEIYWW